MASCSQIPKQNLDTPHWTSDEGSVAALLSSVTEQRMVIGRFLSLMETWISKQDTSRADSSGHSDLAGLCRGHVFWDMSKFVSRGIKVSVRQVTGIYRRM